MTTVWHWVKASAGRILGKPKVRKRLFWILAIFFILQIYFVRELLAAEVLFGLGFAVLALLTGVSYVVGLIGERGLDWVEGAARVIAHLARLTYAFAIEISKKPFRHPHSESAQ